MDNILNIYMSLMNGTIRRIKMIELSVDKFTKISLEKCPHILVGGSTGSGKSYLLKHMLRDIFRSDECRVVIVDPKCVDYQCMVR